jgi:hypothetical protein
MELQNFEDEDALYQFLEEHAGDVERVEFTAAPLTAFSRSEGPNRGPFAGAVGFADGRFQPLEPEELERLLNAGLLNRLQIPIRVEIDRSDAWAAAPSRSPGEWL